MKKITIIYLLLALWLISHNSWRSCAWSESNSYNLGLIAQEKAMSFIIPLCETPGSGE